MVLCVVSVYDSLDNRVKCPFNMEVHLNSNFLTKFLLLILLTISYGHALFLIEPYVGYKNASGKDSDTPVLELEYSGLTYGARAGLTTMGFSVGVDYSLSSSDIEFIQSGGSATDPHDQTMMGAFVGYEFPMMFRVWGSYFFDVSLEDTDGSDKGDELNGDGMGLGVGFTGLPFVSINLEYRMWSIDESVDGADGTKTNTTGVDVIDIKEILVTVSLPLDL